MCQRCAENSGVPRATLDVISYFLEVPADHKDGDRWIEARFLGFFAAAYETILHEYGYLSATSCGVSLPTWTAFCYWLQITTLRHTL